MIAITIVTLHMVTTMSCTIAYTVAAESELSEEAQLKASELINLLPNDHPGVMEVKWCKNRFYPFLALDVTQDSDPKPKDEEGISSNH